MTNAPRTTQEGLRSLYRTGYDAGKKGEPFSWPVMSEVGADAWRLGWATGALSEINELRSELASARRALDNCTQALRGSYDAR